MILSNSNKIIFCKRYIHVVYVQKLNNNAPKNYNKNVYLLKLSQYLRMNN